MVDTPHPHDPVADAQPDPEPIAPSLAEPDRGVFQHVPQAPHSEGAGKDRA